MRKIWVSGLMMLGLAATFGCAARTPVIPTIVYPSPPDEPRIAYLRSYTGAEDFAKKSWMDAIFGKTIGANLAKPYGVAAAGGKIYVTSTAGGVVIVLDTKEKKMSLLGDYGEGKLTLPLGVATGPDGTVYVSDAKKKMIFVFDAKGGLVRVIGRKDEFKNPAGIAVNGALGRIYLADSFGHQVHVLSLQGDPIFEIGKRGNKDGEFNFPTNVAIDMRNNNVYVVDTQNFRVQVFDKDGKFLRKFGMLGDRPGTFTRPKGIGIDREGHVYISDASFNNVQVFDDEGKLLLYFGGAGYGPGSYYLPAGICVDDQDRIYVADQFNNRLQVYQYLSDAWKKEHPEEYKKYALHPEQAPAVKN